MGLVADVFELPIKANSIDCIVASEIIEHVPDPKRFIACLFEVLKPGGKIIITTPYNELIRTSLCIHCNFETPHNAHLHSFTEKNIFQLLPKVNKVKIQLLNSKLLVKTWVQYLLRFLPTGFQPHKTGLNFLITPFRSEDTFISHEELKENPGLLMG